MTIPPEWEDRNGHVNVQYYLTLFEQGGWKVFDREGFDENWFRAAGFSFFDLEHHLNYRAEIRIGDEVTTYTRLLGVSEKRYHCMYFTINETRNRLASTLEYVSIGVDMETRRSAPIPRELNTCMAGVVEAHQMLDWTPPLSGVMQA